MTKLRIVHLEDSPLDAELICERLAEGGIECDLVQVQTRDDFTRAVERGGDLILADFSLPAFDGLSALRIARQLRPDVPFIFVSGAIGEERAIESLKSGATDYVLKQRLERLVPSVRRALREAEDRAERKRLEEALRQRAEQLTEADRRKDEFLAMLSHELRNPLAPVRNALQMMRLRGTADPTLAQARDIIDRQVHHMAQLIDDLLDISRITRGKITLRRRRVDLVAVARQALETARPLIEQRSHRLTVSLPDEPLWLEADALRLEQVFANLLNNAAKYTDPGGQIWLAVRRDGGQGVCSVRDNGIGIAAGTLPHIFDLFAQAERSLDRSQGGLGIGLTLVQRLVGLHGGTVGVTSPGPGRGSEFTVRLPLLLRDEGGGMRDEKIQGGAEAPQTGFPSSLRPHPSSLKKVLVVDDNKDGAESLAMILRFWGHEAELAYDGPAALERVGARRPDVVLLDIGLPGMDGYAVARRLRAQAEGAALLLVAMTGYGQDEDRRRTLEAGFDVHLTKPVDPDELQRLLTCLPSDPPTR